VSIVLALYVVTNVLFTTDLALWTAGAAILAFVAIWYALPMVGRSTSPKDDGEPDQASSPDGQAQESRGASSRR